MNALLNNGKTYCYIEEEEYSEEFTLGDKIAVLIVSMYAASALLIGSWCGVMLFTGRIGHGGPLRYAVVLLQLFGII